MPMRSLAASIATALLIAAYTPAKAADEQHSAMVVWLTYAKTATPKFGRALAVRLLNRHFPFYESCQQWADARNSSVKETLSLLNKTYKWQIVCHKRSATTLADLSLDICGKSGILYRQTCSFLTYKKPQIKKYQRGESVRFQ